MRIVATFSALAVTLTLGAPALAAEAAYDQSFLTDYSKLQPRTTDKGTDLMYVAPGGIEKLAGKSSVMVDQPEVLISPASDYKGAKPNDLLAVANMMRGSLGERLSRGGYNVVETAGAGTVYLRLALTDLQLKKKKRGLLAYTPIGAVVKVGTDSLKDMMEKYDITHMVIQAEITDSQSREVLGAMVAVRGEGKSQRIEFEQLEAEMAEFGSRLRCRLDNSRVPAEQQIDCLDPKARAAREAVSGKT